VAALVDTNVLVYLYDDRYPQKQQIAYELLRRGMVEDSVRIPHQSLIEFVAAVSRPAKGYVILKQPDALREAEEFLATFTILYPNDSVFRLALLGCAAYQLSWFDAHLWAYAEHYGMSELWSEDSQNGRYYGRVRAVNPFLL
jgi:predicted nucleic acid-binding protein